MNSLFVNSLGIVLAGFILLATSLFASSETDGWTSGGGHLRTTEQNPWFVQNTNQVSYCISIDEANFGQTHDIAKAKIESAIAYWKGEFAKADEAERGTNLVKIGSQVFVELPCGANIDVSFQFGTLDIEQERFLKDATATVGIAVRTAYDEVQLRGKGFVYISPEHGRLALKGRNLLANRWTLSGGKLLELILVHELGHVFGLPHTGSNFSIMGEEFPNEVVQDILGPTFARAIDIPNFYGGYETQGENHCGRDLHSKDAEEILGIPQDWKCVKIEMTINSMKIFAAEAPGMQFQLIGSAKDVGGMGKGRSIGRLVLPKNQHVFNNLPSAATELWLYAQYERTSTATYFNQATGAKSQLIISQTPDNFRIDGAKSNGPIELNIESESTWRLSDLSRKSSDALNSPSAK